MTTYQEIGESQVMSYNPRWGSDKVKSRYIRPYQTSSRIIWHCLTLPNSPIESLNSQTNIHMPSGVAIKDLRPTGSYWGIRITRDHKSWTIWINQESYIDNTLKRFKLQDANSTEHHYLPEYTWWCQKLHPLLNWGCNTNNSLAHFSMLPWVKDLLNFPV